jgi:hypothetical protein
LTCRNLATTTPAAEKNKTSIERDSASRHFRGRIGIGDTSASRAPVADRWMRDVVHRQRHERQMRLYEIGIDHFGVPHQCAYADEFATPFDAAKLVDTIDIDQEFRCRETHIQRRHETLATGQDPNIMAAAKLRQCARDCRGADIGEGGRFHRCVPTTRSSEETIMQTGRYKQYVLYLKQFGGSVATTQQSGRYDDLPVIWKIHQRSIRFLLRPPDATPYAAG